MVKRLDDDNIQRFIILAIEFDFIDSLMSKLIARANRNTDQINNILSYIDTLRNPENIISIIDQYDPDVRIGEIRDNLIIAFNKLDLYCKLIQSAVKVSGSQCH